jgi:hypothetical protein
MRNNKGQFVKGNYPHNKGVRGYTNNGTFKIGHPGMNNLRGEQHPSWVGDKVSYNALHVWVRRQLGTPEACSLCDTKTAKRYDWANISGEYKRDVSDWIRLCRGCHIRLDRSRIVKGKRDFISAVKP